MASSVPASNIKEQNIPRPSQVNSGWWMLQNLRQENNELVGDQNE